MASLSACILKKMSEETYACMVKVSKRAGTRENRRNISFRLSQYYMVADFLLSVTIPRYSAQNIGGE